MRSILFISSDVVDLQMGGMGVRNWELARTLSETMHVTLAVPNRTALQPSGFNLISYDLQRGDLRPAAENMDAIVLSGPVLHFHPYLRDLAIPLAVDLYVPSLLESLVWHDSDEWGSWIPAYEEYLRIQGELLRAGDFFFCASERQRDYWIGWLHSQKRVNPHTFRQDPTLRKLIDVVPFGLPAISPKKQNNVIKGKLPGVLTTDRLIVWSGGLWDWLDPLTLIRAMSLIENDHPDYKLYFFGTNHPNQSVKGMKMPQLAIDLSQELGLYHKTVFFGDWVPYDQRGDYLAEGELSVVTHHEHIETHFSFRTRVLDSIWMGIPLIVTQGDSMADIVEKNAIGLTVPEGDPKALAAALEQLLKDEPRETRNRAFERLRSEYRWDIVGRPLRNFCENPSIAADKGQYLTELERVSRDKDQFLEKVAADKDEFWSAVVKDREAVIQRYRNSLPLRIYSGIKRIFGKSM